MGRPYSALAVGCTGKALFGVSSRLHWAIRVRDSFNSKAGLGLRTVSALKQTTPRCRWIHGLHYKCLIRVKTSQVN